MAASYETKEQQRAREEADQLRKEESIVAAFNRILQEEKAKTPKNAAGRKPNRIPPFYRDLERLQTPSAPQAGDTAGRLHVGEHTVFDSFNLLPRGDLDSLEDSVPYYELPEIISASAQESQPGRTAPEVALPDDDGVPSRSYSAEDEDEDSGEGEDESVSAHGV